ncbi:MAG: Protein RecA [Candidatus Daviesbacteria bacterium GW2011_GWA2_38_24]|uniref:Protein RecA n=1 Tax=Candidatus Daviesbacteria bacterium GW2011_GWA2_38_24 TaxID=1618422 RepID=A0A0G0MN71_9BACT|nr:MAG: Protein RecA [Candidatus Daviesbacteria bacterium GW2011_GWA2_38_24]
MLKKKEKKDLPAGRQGDKTVGIAVLENTLKSIQTKFGEGSIMKFGDSPKVDVNVIPTGSLGLDMALGVGGIPRGRIIEIFGPESSGKTTLSLHIVAEAQKLGGICAYIDAEHAMDPEYTKKLGVNINELLISQPDNGEQALEIVESLVRTGKIDVIVIDSVAALTPKDEIEGDMGAYHVGKQARLMSQALRKLTAIVAKSKTSVIFINQIRMQIGVMFGNPETTPGGKALKFYTSVRLDIRKIAQIKKGEEVVGSRTRVKVVKNKVAAPFKQTEFDIIYNEGISKEGEIMALGEKFKIIEKTGNSYFYIPPPNLPNPSRPPLVRGGQSIPPDKGEEKGVKGEEKEEKIKLGVGYDATRTFLKENKKISDQILKEIRKKFAEEV